MGVKRGVRGYEEFWTYVLCAAFNGKWKRQEMEWKDGAVTTL